MQIIEDPGKMQDLSNGLRAEGKVIALVSTSGALHAGHAALIEKARAVADVVVVSAVVNSIEFGPNEDFERYPRNSSGDAEFCELAGVDILFRPAPRELYPEGFSLSVKESSISSGLCGISRPHYFGGVCTLHTLLLNLVHPGHLVLGLRDPQKCAVLRKLVRDLRFQVEIHTVATVREDSGLACNARNAYLNEFQKRDAATLHAALLEGKKLVDMGITNVDRILAEVTHHISQVRRLRVIYVAAVDPETMDPIRSQISPGRTLVMTAIWCDEVRLTDNILL
ncbi:MAG: pantoate--beta-alanine ligase [Opitutales bacterium]|jgi:pantoate--beta-alanine ligase